MDSGSYASGCGREKDVWAERRPECGSSTSLDSGVTSVTGELRILIDAADFGSSGPPVRSYHRHCRPIGFGLLVDSVAGCCRSGEHLCETWDARS